jgi:AcrR family transcriptional regulator
VQKPSPEKRAKILEASARLFARKPYHEVRLDEIAAEARVGKGTLYVYFDSKEVLFDALLVEGFDRLLHRVRGALADTEVSAWDTLCLVVRELVGWAVSSPHFYKLVRESVEHPPTPLLRERRRELGQSMETVILRGVASGEFDDPHPELTAQFIPSCVRGAIRFGPAGTSAEVIADQILRIVGGGIRVSRAARHRNSTRSGIGHPSERRVRA